LKGLGSYDILPVACVSLQALTDTESRYAQIDKELLSSIDCCLLHLW